eukprot:426295_1
MSLITVIRTCSLAFLMGVWDAVKMCYPLVFFISSPTIRHKAALCFLLNGVVFLGGLAFVRLLVFPLLHAFVTGGAPFGVGEWMSNFLNLLVQILWIYPVYFLSFVLSTIWYQDIASQAYLIYRPKIKKEPFSLPRWIQTMSEEIYRQLLISSLWLQVFLMYFVPYVGNALAFLYLCWLYALYSFEYGWSMESWSLQVRLVYFETHAPYFAGFGFPCALISVIFPKFVSYGLFAFMFPLFIITAISANPKGHWQIDDLANAPSDRSRDPSGSMARQFRVPIFRVAKFMNACLFSVCQRYCKRPKEKSK